MNTNMLALPYRSMIDRVIIALLDSPFAVNELKNETKDKKYFDKILYSLLPADVGIEIEVPLHLPDYDKPKWMKVYNIGIVNGPAEALWKYLTKDMTKKSLLLGVHSRTLEVHKDSGCYEITHHMPKKDVYKYIWGLVESLNRYDAVRASGGSIHYHIDISKHIGYDMNRRQCKYSAIYDGKLNMRTTAFKKQKNLYSLVSTLTDITTQYYEFITKKVFEYDGSFSTFYGKLNGRNNLELYNYATNYRNRQIIQPRLDEFGTIEFRMSKCELNYARIMREILIAQLIVNCAKKGQRFNYKLAKKIYDYSKSEIRFEQAC